MRSYASQALKGFTNIVDHTAATVRYQAVGFDQYGKEMDAPADFVYALTDGGELDANHVFTSNGTEGVYSVSAENEKYHLSATVKVTHAETQVVTFPAIELNADKLSTQENFDLMGTAADATLPEGWRIDRQTSAPRTVGSYAASQNQTMYAGGVPTLLHRTRQCMLVVPVCPLTPRMVCGTSDRMTVAIVPLAASLPEWLTAHVVSMSTLTS